LRGEERKGTVGEFFESFGKRGLPKEEGGREEGVSEKIKVRHFLPFLPFPPLLYSAVFSHSAFSLFATAGLASRRRLQVQVSRAMGRRAFLFLFPSTAIPIFAPPLSLSSIPLLISNLLTVHECHPCRFYHPS
jgi:hypothetical protein